MEQNILLGLGYLGSRWDFLLHFDYILNILIISLKFL